MPKANTMLLEGDYVQAVGSEEALNLFHSYLLYWFCIYNFYTSML